MAADQFGGHRRIAYIGRPGRRDPLQEVKAAAFRAETAALDIAAADAPVADVPGMEVHDGYTAARALLAGTSGEASAAARPTAIVCGSYEFARGVLRAAAETGLDVPGMLSVVSYDNIPQMAGLDVPVTAVGADVDAAAEQIAAALIRLIEQPEPMGRTITLEPSIVVRASTASPPVMH